MKRSLSILALFAALPALAEDNRQLDAHEHGVGTLNIAIDGGDVLMEFVAPGADIVGFEYVAESADDRAAVDEAVAILARPLDLFVLPEAAACSVNQASAALESEEEHDDHGDEDAHDHDDDHDNHDEHDEPEEHDDHDEHAEASSHTEFHAEYKLACGDTAKLTGITFAYFETFPNALEVEVQVITPAGAQAFEVERDMPELDLRGLF